MFRGSLPKVSSVLPHKTNLDHVAMLIRLEDGNLIVVEASGGSGVEYNLWKDFTKRGWLKLYER